MIDSISIGDRQIHVKINQDIHILHITYLEHDKEFCSTSLHQRFDPTINHHYWVFVQTIGGTIPSHLLDRKYELDAVDQAVIDYLNVYLTIADNVTLPHNAAEYIGARYDAVLSSIEFYARMLNGLHHEQTMLEEIGKSNNVPGIIDRTSPNVEITIRLIDELETAKGENYLDKASELLGAPNTAKLIELINRLASKAEPEHATHLIQR